MKRRRKRKWLFEQYKLEHPEAFPKQKSKREIPYAVKKMFYIFLLFTVFHVLAILIAAAISADIRSFIF